MENNNILLPALNLEVKKTKSSMTSQTYSFFNLQKMNLESLVDLYKKRPRFNQAVTLTDKVCSRWKSDDIERNNFKFFIEAYNKQDAFMTMLYITYRLNEDGLCDCSKIYQADNVDIDGMGESSTPSIFNMGRGIASIDESEQDDDAPVAKWLEDETEAVFFINDGNMLGSMSYSPLPCTSNLNNISNSILFLGQCVVKFRNTLIYPINELDIKSFADAVIGITTYFSETKN